LNRIPNYSKRKLAIFDKRTAAWVKGRTCHPSQECFEEKSGLFPVIGQPV
jgi:hypothetical protein